MDIRGLVLVNSDLGRATNALAPLSLTDVAGKSPLVRMLERMKTAGIQPLTALMEEDSVRRLPLAPLPRGVERVTVLADSFWRAGENIFNHMAQTGAELVVVVRMGPYAEIEFEQMVQFHLERRCRVCQAVHLEQPLEIFSLSASRRNDAASLFRSRLSRCRSNCPPFVQMGYFNSLAEPRDLRQLAIDILTLKTETEPAGEQVKPGVWVAPHARIEKDARILAPAFIGSSARICSGAVVTRCTAVERRAHVDCGTVIENSTVLPYSYVGAGLDLSHSVAGIGQIANLRRDVTIEVTDQSLIGQVSSRNGHSWLRDALGLLSALPARIRRQLSGAPAPLPGMEPAMTMISPARESASYAVPVSDEKPTGEFPANLAIARRYGNQ